jgi:hypothetical protein
MNLSSQIGPELDFVRAISSLAIDERESLATADAPEGVEVVHPNGCDHDYETGRTSAKSSVGFLTLPAELRLRIYEDALVSRLSGTALKYSGKRSEGKKQILVHLVGSSQNTNMGAGLLRTCKQVYLEANQMLYAQNIFHIREAEDGLRFFERIGSANASNVKSITIWVSYLAELRTWLKLLQTLAMVATGLRRLVLGWGARTDCAISLQRGAIQRGLGDSLDFVRNLARIQGLDELVIQGYFAQPWPAYLEKMMGVKVQAEGGYMTEPPLFGDGWSVQVTERHEIYLQELQALEQRNFADYQRGTDDLIP